MSRTFCASCGKDLQPDSAICACDVEHLGRRIGARYVVSVDGSALTRCIEEIRAELDRLSALLEPAARQRVVDLVDTTCVRALDLYSLSATSRVAVEVPPGLLALRVALRAFDGRGELSIQGIPDTAEEPS